MKIRSLEKSFGSHQVLKGVDLDVYRGETLILLGGSGGGKSVLMKHMIGLVRPDAGSVILEGKDLAGLKERELTFARRRVSMMFQSGALFDSLTVKDNIAFPLREAGIRDKDEISERVAEALKIVKLPGQEEKMPSDLSGGMRKRVALARAVVKKPCCVLYDEPHAGLDPVTADAIDHLIKDLELDHGITNIVVTHEMRSVFRIASRVVFMQEGLVYWEGSADELKKSADPLLKNFIEGRSEEQWD
ncbi:ATP-binding cassette domain-containing protein [bacterium]|nr:ATP-binding cassette domain-containing protein [Akkermansiaceae bacterium]MDB4506370.1 ATP-binding cassette domain-containing protein [bacterium]MDB4275543.1 ATP-binding cassette domain-containing protein [Akkermansiaceae bacterium]MDB4301518.1 ATP-binding cassette domain-containing protein [Akkermansiaceae bacterium]MDB4305485.1 ATP-binding cassette domain-containing protein [Akkermansiaceae bacterium]